MINYNNTMIMVFTKSQEEKEYRRRNIKRLIDEAKKVVENTKVAPGSINAAIDNINILFMKSYFINDKDVKYLTKQELEQYYNVLCDARSILSEALRVIFAKISEYKIEADDNVDYESLTKEELIDIIKNKQ